MSLYALRLLGLAFTITKFDDDMNPEGSYIVTSTTCTCPAGPRPSCRHRKMLPKMVAHINDGWFYNYETQKWHRPVEDLLAEPAEQLGPKLSEMASDSATHLSPSDHGHQLYMTSDNDAPDVIKDRNGEVVLELCRKCGCGEIELDSPCPGAPALAGAAGSQHHSPSGSAHQIRCKITGEAIASKLDGGWCMCQPGECRAFPDDPKVNAKPTPPVQGIRRRV